MSDTRTNSSIRDKSFCNEENLKRYLQDKTQFSLEDQQLLKHLIDNYSDCWRSWNKVRWDAAMNSEGVKELKEYLGKDFIPYYDSSWELAKEWNSKTRSSKKMVEDFYKNTKNYIYNSIIFNYSGDRIKLSQYWEDLVRKYNIQSVIDYGCGVGNDGLDMLKKNVRVVFCDFSSPTLEFLKWRIKKRNTLDKLYSIKSVEELRAKPEYVDMFWVVDVLEHMQNPLEIFDCIHPDTKLIVMHTDCDDKAGGRHPFHFKINDSLLEVELRRRNYNKVPHQRLGIWLKKS